jgi:hypothetical protein
MEFSARIRKNFIAVLTMVLAGGVDAGLLTPGSAVLTKVEDMDDLVVLLASLTRELRIWHLARQRELFRKIRSRIRGGVRTGRGVSSMAKTCARMR